MVLECGDIDLARLLARHEKGRREGAAGEIDENFIRLYWQQMLQVGLLYGQVSNEVSNICFASQLEPTLYVFRTAQAALHREPVWLHDLVARVRLQSCAVFWAGHGCLMVPARVSLHQVLHPWQRLIGDPSGRPGLSAPSSSLVHNAAGL